MSPDDQRAALAGLVADSGESLAGLSRWLGRNDAYLQQYLRRGSPRLLPEEERGRLAHYFGVADAVLGGATTLATVRVPRVAIAASAGPGALVEDEAVRSGLTFDVGQLRALGVDPARASVIRVRGDSMAPTLHDGDEILVDTRARQITSTGGLYVVRIDGELMVKRLRAVSGGAVAVMSDNPAHPSIGVCPLAAVNIIGRVAWLGRVPG